MKKFTKLLGIVLMVALVMSMGTAAFAAGTNSITVDINFEGQEYSLYKIFNATTNEARQGESDTNSSSSVTAEGIAYTLIDEETTQNTGHGLTAEYSITTAAGTTKTVKAGDWFEYVNDSSKNIKQKNGADITTEDFRLFALKYGVKIGNTLTAATNNATNIKWENLDDGYYFISTTTGSLVTVDSVAPAAIVKDKNSPPSIDKTVEEDSTGIYQKQNDAEIGQTVYFKTVIHAKKGGVGYKLLDKMSTGLNFDGVNSIKVYKGSVEDANLVATTNYTAAAGGVYTPANEEATPSTEAVNADFTVMFTQAFLDTITTDTDIIVTYTATVSSDAVINTGIENDSVLEYGNNTRTEESSTNTYIWGIDVLKKDGQDATKQLEGAKFVIYRTETETPADGEPVTSIYYAKFDSNNKFAGWTAADSETAANLVKKEETYFTEKQATVLTTSSDDDSTTDVNEAGKIVVTGLDEGSYYLLEVVAPSGYNKLDVAKDFTITSTVSSAGASLENELTSGTNGSTHIDVNNNSGTVLPSTGGIGTTIFYVVGSVLVIAAGVLLVTKKRMGRD